MKRIDGQLVLNELLNEVHQLLEVKQEWPPGKYEPASPQPIATNIFIYNKNIKPYNSERSERSMTTHVR